MLTKSDVGNILRSIRINSGYSQAELGKMIGKTQQTLARWERGENQPDIATLFQICELCGTTVSEAFNLPAAVVGEVQRRQEIGADAGSATYEHALKVVEGEEQMLGLYRELNPEGQAKALDLIDDMVQSGKYIKNNSAGMVDKQA